MATAEFSKFAGMLSAALSQHHLLGFEIAQLIIELNYIQLSSTEIAQLALFIVILLKAHLTSHSRMSDSK